MRTCIAMQAAVLCVLLSGVLMAGHAAEQTSGGVLITPAAFQVTELATVNGIDDVLVALDYDENEKPRVFAADFNDDRIPDYLIISHERLCGTAGCSYSLVDGKSGREIGTFFGHVAVLDQRVNGFRVIQTLSKRDLSTVNLSTFTFDGKRFVESRHALLDEQAAGKWLRGIATMDHPGPLPANGAPVTGSGSKKRRR